ncbi:MAG: histidine kinase N-terminal 7TM domain-containing protein, partial [Verrucomicrobiota bacterium]
MTSVSILGFVSVGLAVLLALAVLLRGRRSPANRLFIAGMASLACNNLFEAFSLQSGSLERVLFWQAAALFTMSVSSGIWLCFSLTYSRGNYREFLARWQLPVMLTFLTPIICLAVFPDQLTESIRALQSNEPVWIGYGGAGKVLNFLILIIAVLVLMNLEKTFRTAVGTMRWRMKFVTLGLCVIFGAKIYIASQAMLYSGMDLSFLAIEAMALLIGCVLISISYQRSGRVEIDVYPSHAFVYSSVTVIVAGIYLLIVGLLARLVTHMGGDAAFPLKALLVLVGTVSLALVLLSDRLRQRTKRFLSRHLQRPLYDYRDVWRKFTEGTLSRVEQTDLCRAVVTFVSNLFQVLSVTIWVVDREKQRLVFAASTSLVTAEGADRTPQDSEASEIIRAFQEHPEPVDIDAGTQSWHAALRRCTPGEFQKGDHRTCVPIRAGGQLIGLMTLGDRVDGIPLSTQDIDLLKCIADQAAASLGNIQLSQRLMQAKEMEAFQTMSAFFVHDLKNTASTLSLMLKNLPIHFNDPAFREDALRGISNTVDHINSLIGRLSLIRQGLAIQPAEIDLNALISKTLTGLDGSSDTKLIADLGALPMVPLDAEQVQKVLLNLVLNAKEALGRDGEIRIQTRHE